MAVPLALSLALFKDSSMRFENCSAFVRQLTRNIEQATKLRNMNSTDKEFAMPESLEDSVRTLRGWQREVDKEVRAAKRRAKEAQLVAVMLPTLLLALIGQHFEGVILARRHAWPRVLTLPRA
jgi:hypothetical protein